MTHLGTMFWLTSRRDIFRWGLFALSWVLRPIGLNPFIFTRHLFSLVSLFNTQLILKDSTPWKIRNLKLFFSKNVDTYERTDSNANCGFVGTHMKYSYFYVICNIQSRWLRDIMAGVPVSESLDEDLEEAFTETRRDIHSTQRNNPNGIQPWSISFMFFVLTDLKHYSVAMIGIYAL